MSGGESVTDELSELPPTAKLVAKALEYEGELTKQGICEETHLSARSAHDGISRLDAAGFLESRPNPDDARQDLYRLDV